MKNFKFTSCIVLVLLVFASCSQKPSELIVGEWKITDIKTTQEIPEEQMEFYNENVNEMISTSKFVINADGTCENTILDVPRNGKWSMNEEGTVLTIAYDEGSEEISKIEELSTTKLVTSIDINEAKNTITYEKK